MNKTLIVGSVLLLVLVVALGWWLRRNESQRDAADRAVLATENAASARVRPEAAPTTRAPRPGETPDTGGFAPLIGPDSWPGGGDSGAHPVDLDALRQELPDNRYWVSGAPTDDPELIAARKRDTESVKRMRGLIVSGGASEQEIESYFDERRRLSKDYIQISERILERYGATLPDPELGMHQLSISMHRKRLAGLPRKREQAHERRVLQETRRREWRGD
ncbi:MAG: hypothetical protein AAF605_00020 [Myxococcota bacterium]